MRQACHAGQRTNTAPRDFGPLVGNGHGADLPTRMGRFRVCGFGLFRPLDWPRRLSGRQKETAPAFEGKTPAPEPINRTRLGGDCQKFAWLIRSGREDFSDLSVTDPRRPSDHIPLGRRSAFQWPVLNLRQRRGLKKGRISATLPVQNLYGMKRQPAPAKAGAVRRTAPKNQAYNFPPARRIPENYGVPVTEPGECLFPAREQRDHST